MQSLSSQELQLVCQVTDKLVDRFTDWNGPGMRSSPSREEFNNGGLTEIWWITTKWCFQPLSSVKHPSTYTLYNGPYITRVEPYYLIREVIELLEPQYWVFLQSLLPHSRRLSYWQLTTDKVFNNNWRKVPFHSIRKSLELSQTPLILDLEWDLFLGVFYVVWDF